MFARSAVLAAIFFQGVAVRRQRSKFGCQSKNDLMAAAQKFVNGKIANLLAERKELTLDLFTVGKEIKLFGCDVALSMTSDLNVSGLDSLGVQGLECANEECVEMSEDGTCAKKQFDIDFAFGLRNLLVKGSSDIDLEACRKGLGTDIDLEYNIAAPQFMVSTKMEEQEGLSLSKYKIAKLVGVNWQFGDVTKTYDCGFEKLPKSIEEKVESWCETAMQWTAEKVHKKILKQAVKAVKRLIDRTFNNDGDDVTPAMAEPAQPPARAPRRDEAPEPAATKKPSRFARWRQSWSARKAQRKAQRRSRR